ncbi:MAG TPA: DUF4391 domain-containing protein [Paludibacter sp.]
MFDLPASTIVDKPIPKNTFDEYATPKQKKLFTNIVAKIKWANKLSLQTINLQGNEVQEIQIFEIELKEKSNISELLLLMNRVIPYPILFEIKHEEFLMYSISQKHSHPTNENQAVVDWTFTTEWKTQKESSFVLQLAHNLDFVFSEICFQISGKQSFKDRDVIKLIELEQKMKQLNLSVEKLTASIKNCKQFNRKVELNRQLRILMDEKNDLERCEIENLTTD